jgi:hypothetical protein
VYFLVENTSLASSVMRGGQVAAEMLRQGVFAQVIDLSDQGVERAGRIKNGIVVFIKNTLKGLTPLMPELKRRNNFLVWDPIDGLLDLKDDPGLGMVDGVIFSNERSVREYRHFLGPDCNFHVISHHWDPRCRPNTAGSFKLVFLGDPTPENIAQEHIDNVAGLTLETVKAARDVKDKDLFSRMTAYSCHFSVRKEESASFIYKPAPKIAMASAMRANIILSRDYSNLEVLDRSYPFYTSAKLDDVLRVTACARDSYGTRAWRDALDMMAAVRERTSLPKIAKDYINHFKKY